MLAMKRTLTLIAAVGMLAIPGMVPTASALPHPDGDHYQYYFLSTDGITNLHADVLRPKGLPNYVRTPVIVTVSPYTNHNGATTEQAAADDDQGGDAAKEGRRRRRRRPEARRPAPSFVAHARDLRPPSLGLTPSPSL